MDEYPPPRRRRFRFSLRGLLIGMVVLSVASVWVGHRLRTRELEAALRSAQLDLEQHQDAERRAPGVIPQSEMRRLELVRDGAKLSLDRANAVPSWHGNASRDLDRRLAGIRIEILEIELLQARASSSRSAEHGFEIDRQIAALIRELAAARRQAEPTGK
jgi:hypothetical protein